MKISYVSIGKETPIDKKNNFLRQDLKHFVLIIKSGLSLFGSFIKPSDDINFILIRWLNGESNKRINEMQYVNK